MTVDAGQAVTAANQFLQQRFGPAHSYIVKGQPDTYYGYYTCDVKDALTGLKVGMLSVNGTTGHASVLSKTAAAGSTHVVIDIPIGATAKVRTREADLSLGDRLRRVGTEIGLDVWVVTTDGSQGVAGSTGILR